MSTPSPIEFDLEERKESSKTCERRVSTQDCENHTLRILPAMENEMEIREDMEEASVLINLTLHLPRSVQDIVINFSRD